MKKFIILIDTSFYEKNIFDFSNKAFTNMINFYNKNKTDIEFVSSSIIDNEIISHIKKYNDTCYQRIKKCNLENTNGKIIEKLKKEIFEICKIEKIIEENKCKNIEAFNSLKSKLNMKEISYDNVSIKKIFDDYFNEKPPFNEGNKKYEFPDAVILNSLLNYTTDKNDDFILISIDNDWDKFAKVNKKIFCFKDFFSFQDFFNNSNSIKKEILEKTLNSEAIDEIKKNIENEIQTISFYTNGWDNILVDEEVIDTKCQEIHIDTSAINITDINYNDKKDITNITFICNFIANCSSKIKGYDADSWHRDSDDGSIYFYKTRTEETNHNVNGYIEIKIKEDYTISDIKAFIENDYVPCPEDYNGY